MTAVINKTRTTTDTEAAGFSSDKLVISLFGTSSVLIGIWAAACLVSAVVSEGPISLLRGYVSALTGM